MAARASWVGLALLVLLSGAALADETVEARVTYVTGSSVYVDAGTDQGLRVGSRLELFREGTAVAVLEVREATRRRAVCAVVEGSVVVEVDDRVRFTPQAAPAPEAAEAEPARRPRRGGLRAAGIRGRIGARYLAVRNRNEGGADFSQPALDLRLDGTNIAGSAWGLNVDVRARRTYRDLSDGGSDDDRRTRVYRLATSWSEPGGGWGVVAGRQFSPALSGVSIFDGISLEYGNERWTAGLLSGSQPDAEDFGYSSEIREHGLYFRLRGGPTTEKRWVFTTGLIGSYQDSEVNREFLYLQGRYTGPRFSAFATQEVDFNPAWKTELGDDSVEATSSYVSLRYRFAKAFTLRGGFDNRRNVRLWRDRETPETVFDDTFRRGAWLGALFRIGPKFRLGLDGRTRRGEDDESADSYTLTLGAHRLTRLNLRVSSRSTGYSNERVEGWLHSVSAGVDLGPAVALQLTGGLRDEENLLNGFFDERVTWFGADLDVSLGRHWYLILSAERTDGDLEQVDQLYTSLTYRF